jgi:hypothetical protein
VRKDIEMQEYIGKMAKKMYPIFIIMGFMIVAASFIGGYFNSQTAAAYFAAPKEIRETTLMADRVSIEAIGLWLPYFKFLGLGLILGGIVMALRVIIDRLKTVGEEVLVQLPADVRPEIPGAPWYGLLMPGVMMLGEMVFIGSLGVAIWLSGLAAQLFSNPVPAIDAAGAGSPLLSQMETIHAVNAWLVPLKFVGIATEFLAIAMGLGTVVFLLNKQTELLDQGVRIGKDQSVFVNFDERETELVAN